MREHHVLVIGVGNRDRGDDAAGPVVCDLLAAEPLPCVDILVFEGSVLDLPVRWSLDDRVVIVDASAPAGHPGRVTEVDAISHRLSAPGSASTHTVDVGTAVELARALGRMPAALSIVGIEGASFGFGDAPHPAVLRAAKQVAARINRRASRATGDP